MRPHPPLRLSTGGDHYEEYEGDYFTGHAGPICLNAAGGCVTWTGRITETEGKGENTDCG